MLNGLVRGSVRFRCLAALFAVALHAVGTVLGIAARNGIMMISHFQHLEREEGKRLGPALVPRVSSAPSLVPALGAFALAVAAGGCGAAREHATARPLRAFSRPTVVDNRWLPLRPGLEYVYDGTARDDSGRLVSHRVLFYVTGLTKTIDGVRTVVLWDRDYYGGALREDELTFWAQDDRGTVWNFGEYPEEVEHGRVTGAPDTWIAGVQGARAGVAMPGAPQESRGAYLQGYAPRIGFADRARLRRRGARTCVPAGCFRDVLVNEEWSPGDRGAHQLKYYAPGVGSVRVGYTGHERDAERLVLLRVERLTPRRLAAVRAAARRQDRRGRRVSPAVYGRTARLG